MFGRWLDFPKLQAAASARNRAITPSPHQSIQISRCCPNCQIRELAHLLFDRGRDSTSQTHNPHHRQSTLLISPPRPSQWSLSQHVGGQASAYDQEGAFSLCNEIQTENVKLTYAVPREGQNSTTQKRASSAMVSCRRHKSAQKSTCMLASAQSRVFFNVPSDSQSHRPERPSIQLRTARPLSLVQSSSSLPAVSGESASSFSSTYNKAPFSSQARSGSTVCHCGESMPDMSSLRAPRST